MVVKRMENFNLIEHKVKFREFFEGKDVYGVYNKKELVGLIPVSNNIELQRTKKIYAPCFDKDYNELNVKAIKGLVKILLKEKDVVIYTDCLKEHKKTFEDAGFNFASVKKNLKRYGELHRGVYNGK